MITENDRQAYLTAWRRAEDKFYGSVLNMPELYTDGVRLVRGLADSLSEIKEVDALFEAYPHLDISQVATTAEALDLTLRDFLDYSLARDAAFYLRYQELVEATAQADMQARLAEARSRGEIWVTLAHNETPRQGTTFFQRLEMRLSDGLALYSAVELDWEKGRVYVVELVMLDPATGLPKRGVSPPEPRQEFTTREEMMARLAALRQKYSGTDYE